MDNVPIWTTMRPHPLGALTPGLRRNNARATAMQLRARQQQLLAQRGEIDQQIQMLADEQRHIFAFLRQVGEDALARELEAEAAQS
jgi:hypothetical protein